MIIMTIIFTSQTVPTHCIDVSDDCVSLKTDGACQSDEEWMVENCRMSCGACNRTYQFVERKSNDYRLCHNIGQSGNILCKNSGN